MGSKNSILVLLVLVLMALDIGEASHEGKMAKNNTTTSQFLKKVSRKPRPRETGCWIQPWICKDRFPPFRRMMCCKNRCIDVGSDENNCGFCGIRCPFSWQCCNGFCINTMFNPFHCGKCTIRCPFGSLCIYGLCGYAQPLPPFPFPPKHPKPPFPFPPKHPKPPFPFPFPPKPLPPPVVVFPTEPPPMVRPPVFA